MLDELKAVAQSQVDDILKRQNIRHTNSNLFMQCVSTLEWLATMADDSDRYQRYQLTLTDALRKLLVTDVYQFNAEEAKVIEDFLRAAAGSKVHGMQFRVIAYSLVVARLICDEVP